MSAGTIEEESFNRGLRGLDLIRKTRTEELYLRNPRLKDRYIIFGCQVSMKSRMKIRKPAPTRIWMRVKMEMSR
jgi:hypothetical protein